MIGPEKKHHSINQLDANLTPITNIIMSVYIQNHKNRRYISGANLCSRRLVFSFTPTNKFGRWLRESNPLYISWPEILPFSRKFLVLLTNHIHLTKV